MKRARPWLWIGGALIVAALAALISLAPVREWFDSFEDAIERMDFTAGLLAFTAAYVGATLLLLPAWIFPLAAGALFGFAWGIAAAVAATIGSATAAFVLSRYLLRGRIDKLARRHRYFKAFDQAVGKEGWRVVALLRLSPLLSFGMKSYFFGLTRVQLAPYMAGTLAGVLPSLALKVYLGSVGRSALKGGDPLQWSLLAAGLVATIAASIVVTRLTRKRLKLAAG